EHYDETGARARRLDLALPASVSLGAQRRRPDPVPAGREDAVRVDGVLDRLAEPAVGVIVERVLVGGEVHEVEVGAILAVALLRGLLDEQARRVIRAAHLRLV